MSTTTTNLGLIKPELTDAADITATNPNWDRIDNLTADDIGAFSIPQSCDNTDLNDLKTTGFYYGHTGITHAPAELQCFVEVFAYSPDWVEQRYYSIRQNNTWMRSFTMGTTWSEWQEVYTSGNKPTAEDVGAPTVAEMEQAIAAIPTPDVSGQIEEHDNDANAHSSIRNAMMPKAGGTMTGNLKISKANSPTIELQTSNSNGYTNISQHGGILTINAAMSNSSDDSFLTMSAPSDDDSDLVRIGKSVNNVNYYYKIYGEHNKPTAEDVGAATTAEVQTIADSKAPMYQYSTTDLTAGSSPLATGTLYFVYE